MVAKIDKNLFRVLWTDGVSTADIAGQFDVGTAAVHNCAKKLGLPPRPRIVASTKGIARIKAPRAKERPEPAPPADLAKLSLDQALAVAKGYADLERIAERFGLSLVGVQARWHRRRA